MAKRASKPKPAAAKRPAALQPALPAGPPPHHVAAISATVLILLGPRASVRSIGPATFPQPSRWVPHLQRPLMRSEHEPRRRDRLTRRTSR